MVSAYFKNIGQTKTLIELIQQRNEIQNLSSIEMNAKFSHYNLGLEEVLIGTPTSSKNDTNIEQILTQLRSRQIAKEQLETYETQQRAAEKEKELKEAEAIAKQQTSLTESEVDIVPKTIITTVSGEDGKAVPNAFESLVILMLSEKLDLNSSTEAELSPESERIRKEILGNKKPSNIEAK